MEGKRRFFDGSPQNGVALIATLLRCLPIAKHKRIALNVNHGCPFPLSLQRNLFQSLGCSEVSAEGCRDGSSDKQMKESVDG